MWTLIQIFFLFRIAGDPDILHITSPDTLVVKLALFIFVLNHVKRLQNVHMVRFELMHFLYGF